MGNSGKKYTGRSALRLIFKQLDKSAKEKLNTILIPPKYTSLSAEQLYTQFLKVVPDHKGLVSSSHASYGVEFNLELYMDFGNLLFPPGVVGGVPINLSGGMTYLGSALLLVSRLFPRELTSPPPPNPQPGSSNPTSAPGNAPGATPATGSTQTPVTQANANPVWTTSKPVSFNSMFGATIGFQVYGDASLSFSKSPSDAWSAKKDLENKEENAKYFGYVGLPASAGGGVKIAGKVWMEWMYLKDKGPGWYSQGVSKTLLTDFKTVLGDVSKTEIKEEAIRWLVKYAYIFNWDVFAQSTPVTDPQKEAKRQQYLAERKELWIGYLKKVQKNVAIEESKKAIEASSPGLSLPIPNLVKAVGSFMNWADAKTRSTDDLLNAIDTLLGLLPKSNDIPVVAWTPQDRGKLLTALNEIKDTGESLKERLTKAKNLKAAGTKNDLPIKIGTRNLQSFHQYLSFLTMVSSGGEASGSGVGGASVFSLEGGVKGRIKSSRYRFQNYAISSRKGTLVYTQETAIHYKQIEGTASANFLWLSKGKEGELLNTVSYTSTCIYWRYPGGKVSSVPAETGSGVSFGTTLVLEDLAACANLLIGSSPLSRDAKDMIDTLATQLRVSPEILERFFRSEFIANLKPGDVGGRSAILIESSFRFGNGMTINVEEKTMEHTDPVSKAKSQVPVYQIDDLETENTSIPVFLTAFQPPKNNTNKNYLSPICERLLDGLRLRVRIGDSTESETPFKIGPHLIGISSPGITLKKIEKAGEEGVIDIFEVRFGQNMVNNNPVSAADEAYQTATKKKFVGPKTKQETEKGYLYYEDCVPPVTLLFQ